MARECQITEKDLVATSINVAGLLTASRQRFSERTQNDQIEFNKFLAGDISFDDLQEHFAKRLSTPRGSAERAAIEATQLDAKEQNQFNLDVAAVNNFKNGLWGYDQFINYFEDRQGQEAADSDDFISIDNILTQVRNNQNRFEITIKI